VHAKVLSSFSVPGGGLAGDGHRSPRVWLSWQTAATRRDAGAKVAWMHRLAGHPLVAAALGDGAVSVSWAQQIMDWTRPLPGTVRGDADGELLAAAANGAALADLAQIAAELRRVHARPDTGGDGFEDRRVRLARTFGGAGRPEGDLDPRCAAATEAVPGALAQPRGPEDTRTAAQRQHDALEEAMIRLLAADGLLPQRAGQPVRLELDISLQELANLGAGSAAGPGSTCDAVIQPVITGLPDEGPAHRAHRAPATRNRNQKRRRYRTGPPGRAITGWWPATATPGTRTGGTTCKPPRPGPPARPRSATCSPGPSRCCPARPGGRPGCAAKRPASPPPPSACRWTSPPPPTPSRCTCAARSANGISTAGFPAVTCPPPAARCITSPTVKTGAGTP